VKPLPFNACDYRCERCLETDSCRLYQMLQERRTLNRIMGIDEEDISSIGEELVEILKETQDMLKKLAEEIGVDPESLSEEDDLEEQLAKDDPLYIQAHEFTLKTHDFLKKIDVLINSDAREYFEDIMWHHTIVSAKMYRALISATHKETIDDAINSAAVAVKSLNICIIALDYISSGHSAISGECKSLREFAESLKMKIRLRLLS